MKANNINGTIKVFSRLPDEWKNYINFKEADLTLQHQEGFYDLIQPTYDSITQRLGEIYWDETEQYFSYLVIDKTTEELQAEKESLLQSIEAELDIKSLKLLLRLLTSDILNSPTIKTEELEALVTVYPQFRENKAYIIDEVFVYNNELYKVVQAHTSQANWLPNELPALYTKYTPPGQIAEWVQPTGAQDDYNLGDKVTHNGNTWESTTANNVWEPGVYGWIIV